MRFINRLAPFLNLLWGMKLRQGQTWKCGDEFVRIVDLQRLEVGYKVLKSLKTNEGTHRRTSKKEFCRMLKNADLVEHDSIQQ